MQINKMRLEKLGFIVIFWTVVILFLVDIQSLIELSNDDSVCCYKPPTVIVKVKDKDNNLIQDNL